MTTKTDKKQERMIGDSYMICPSLLKKVKAEAKSQKISKSEFIRRLLREAVS